jgi:hypothetical protein
MSAIRCDGLFIVWRFLNSLFKCLEMHVYRRTKKVLLSIFAGVVTYLCDISCSSHSMRLCLLPCRCLAPAVHPCPRKTSGCCWQSSEQCRGSTTGITTRLCSCIHKNVRQCLRHSHVPRFWMRLSTRCPLLAWQLELARIMQNPACRMACRQADA